MTASQPPMKVPGTSQTKASSSQSPSVLDKLDKIALNENLDEMRKLSKEARFIAGRLALAGQITFIYAGPNKGKTLITLRLISECIESQTNDLKYYYINLDDNFDGLITKTELSNRHGFKVLGPDRFKKPNENFSYLVEELIKEDVANRAVFVLDTIKKFVDVMDKKASSQFMTTCRRLIAAGGSVIGLAHVNKHTNGEESIPAGTSDTLDDCDCAYILDEIGEEKNSEGTLKTVEFRQKKSRGPTVTSAVYKYQITESKDYEALFNSVRLIDGNEADQERTNKAIRSEKKRDAKLIGEISNLLKRGKAVSQQDIVKAITGKGTSSRRNTLSCLKRWSCSVEGGGLWVQKKGTNNSNLFTLIL